jgi:hypothetical protein
MATTQPPTSSARSNREIPVQKPRWAFWKGLLTGAAIEIPLIAATVWLVAHTFGVGNTKVGFMPIMRLAAVFAGVAALFTAGGIGRLAAYATVEKGRRRAIIAAARAHAFASAGLVLIAAVPQGDINFRHLTWLVLPFAGMVAGAICGAIIGTICTSSTAVGLADVWSLTLKPSEALRQLLSPADLVRLGSALRSRTSTLFEGIFEPAPPRPKEKEPEKAITKAEALSLLPKAGDAPTASTSLDKPEGEKAV